MADIEMDYQQALDYLYGFVDYSLTRQLRYSPEKFNLDRMKQLMKLMGDPFNRYPVIHVAGTKGKGSTSAMIASILQSAGYRVGLYTSPHLQDFTERIQINGIPISHADFVRQVNEVKEYIAQVPEITTFEITTALGFKSFADAHVEVAVVEVGLGGRLDATNIVDPAVSVITALSLDHMNILGDTIEKIASEKGGIVKTGRPTVLAPQCPQAQAVIEEICYERNSPLTIVSRDYQFDPVEHTTLEQTFQVKKLRSISQVSVLSDDSLNSDAVKRFTIPLLGQHQVENAVTAYATIGILQKSGFNIPDEAIVRGFLDVSWPGRFEIARTTPTIILDSAHNQDSALRLRQTMDKYFPNRDVILLFGSSEDKDVRGMYTHLLPIVNTLIVTRSTHPRAMETNILVELAGDWGKQIIQTESVEEGIQKALAEGQQHSIILVTGSIFIVAAARDILQTGK